MENLFNVGFKKKPSKKVSSRKKFLLKKQVFINWFIKVPEAATQRCSEKKVFWKYAANLQENTHAEVWFQLSYKPKQLYWNGTSAWVIFCKFAADFQNTFS